SEMTPACGSFLPGVPTSRDFEAVKKPSSKLIDRFQKRGKLGCMSEPLIRRINREQMLWRAVDVEQLIGEDHPARAIWELVGRLDLDGFYEGIECSEEEGGRPAYDPRLLISLWIYAYSQGIGSAREVGRRSEWELAWQWLRD